MFLYLQHKNLDVYKVSRLLVREIYIVTKRFDRVEMYGIVQQIRRAAVSVKLNISEGASRRSPVERKRFYEIARGSVIELESALETAHDIELVTFEELKPSGDLILRCFQMLSQLLNNPA